MAKMSNIEWSYEGDSGPKNWAKMYINANGKHQSPIDIEEQNALYNPKLFIDPLCFNFDKECFKKVEMLGHTFNVSGEPEAESCIEGGPLSHKYKFLQFHFHWGKNDNEGSEHLIDGKQYSAELHIVNWNSELYSSATEAINSKKHDGLVVFGILLKVGKENPEINCFLPALKTASEKGTCENIENYLNIQNLMPQNLDYFTYKGSLTTPPFTECVQWIVFKNPIEASREQFNHFRNLNRYSDERECCSKIKFNYRPCCKLNKRQVFKSMN